MVNLIILTNKTLLFIQIRYYLIFFLFFICMLIKNLTHIYINVYIFFFFWRTSPPRLNNLAQDGILILTLENPREIIKLPKRRHLRCDGSNSYLDALLFSS